MESWVEWLSDLSRLAFSIYVIGFTLLILCFAGIKMWMNRKIEYDQYKIKLIKEHPAIFKENNKYNTEQKEVEK